MIPEIALSHEVGSGAGPQRDGERRGGARRVLLCTHGIWVNQSIKLEEICGVHMGIPAGWRKRCT